MAVAAGLVPPFKAAPAHPTTVPGPTGKEPAYVSVFNKLMRAGEGKILRKLHRIADQVNSIEEDFLSLSDAELRALTDEYKERYADGESLDDLMPEAFATVREAAKRVLGQRPYDVQLMGGAALHLGYVRSEDHTS